MTYLFDGAIDRLRPMLDLPDLRGTKYDLLEMVARGGMGTIYLAEDRDLQRRVALKVLTLPDVSGRMVERMRNEARIVARLEHPSIIPIHDVGQLPDGRVYYTMKFVQGRTMTAWLKDDPPLASRLRLLQQVCEGLAFAHSRGIIHRDLKPDNIMVGSFGEVLVMDWGVAKEIGSVPRADRASVAAGLPEDQPPAGETGDGTTARGAIVGTPAFMSPEQAAGNNAEVDERSDVYMLGSTLFYALTGKAPFDGLNAADRHGSAGTGNAPSPRRFDESIPKALAAICLKALARDKARRYQGALELSADLERLLNQEPVLAYPENVVQRSARWLRKHQFIVVILITYLILRALTFFFLRR